MIAMVEPVTALLHPSSINILPFSLSENTPHNHTTIILEEYFCFFPQSW